MIRADGSQIDGPYVHRDFLRVLRRHGRATGTIPGTRRISPALLPSYEITLVSFEKPDANREALRRELSDYGIGWLPLDYHRRPPVLSTAARRVRRRLGAEDRASRRMASPTIVHVRSYVPCSDCAGWRGDAPGARLIFDIRGFWADERVEGGWWPAGGWLYRVAKRCERWFFREADAVVTLTQASVPQIREWVGERGAPIVVIPTCAELDRFSKGAPRDGETTRDLGRGWWELGTTSNWPDLSPRRLAWSSTCLLVKRIWRGVC